ncbi:MAG: GNAT family N-acetyltransferase [Candidatus Nanohaloarchaea archaeon]
MDAFGILNIENPEEFLQNNPEVTDSLVDVAQSAFSQPKVPPAEETKEHVLPHPTLILAYDNKNQEYVGFSSANEIAETVYESGIAVREDLKGNGLGKAMLSKTIEEQLEGDEGFVTYRTQNPLMYDCSREVFNAFPREQEATPEELERKMDQVAETLDPDNEFDRPVVREAYSAPMYSDLPDVDSRDFLEHELGMDYERGDAVIVAGEVTQQEVEEKVDEYVTQNSEISEVRIP